VAPSVSMSPLRRPLVASGKRTRLRRILAAGMLALAAVTPFDGPVVAAEAGPAMNAAVMLEGHGRVGSWMAIQVRLRNDGPPVTGELRLTGGVQGRTRFGTPVDLPTQSDKTYLLYAQPPAFGGTLDVTLVDGTRTVATSEVAFTVHDNAQLVVGVIAEQPEGIVPRIDGAPDANSAQPAIVPLAIEDLPERVEAWAPLDRLIWQDVDSSQLAPGQVAALRGWLAGGGRLIIAGGTGGGPVLAGFPDDILPYRPSASIDVPPDSLSSLLGEIPATATDVLALGGDLARGSSLATVGDTTIAAEVPYGLGGVAIVGFDPTRGWIGELDAVEALWRRFLPPRVVSPLISGDDNQLVHAVSQFPALALPPIGGLLALLAGYIVLIGPINYLVLRRLDRREWAWVTMPVLIAIFAAGAYGFGAALRGLDVIVNEVAIVRGAPGATEGSAQVYLGVFSPSRGTYQVEVPGGALLSSTVDGGFGGGSGGALDVVQGDPSRIRDLVVGFGSLRTLRAETAALVPLLRADLRLEGGRLVGTIRNESDETLERPAIVLGGSAIVLRDMLPGVEHSIDLTIRSNPFGQALSDRILGTISVGESGRTSESTQRNVVRHAVIDQLTFDPIFGQSIALASDTPVLLAWGRRQVVDVRISGQAPRRTGNVLYYVPLPMQVEGDVAFEGELMRSSLIESDADFFNKDPSQISMGRGTATVAYRPIPFEGAFTPSRVVLSLSFGEDGIGERPTQPLVIADPQPCRDEATDPPDCTEPVPPACDPLEQDCSNVGIDGMPELDLFDRSGGGAWVRARKPIQGTFYEVEDPGRYIDPASGTLLVRFVNDFQEHVGFNFQIRIEGRVR